MKRIVFLLALVLFCAAPRDANALLCSPLLGCSCTVSATPVGFGNISPMGGTMTASGQITVDCTGIIDLAPTVAVKMNRGLYGTLAARQMRTTGGDMLNYNLYTPGGSIWGDGTGTTVALLVSGGLLTLGHWNVTQNVQGRVTPTVTTKPGSYADTVTVRIDW